MKNLIKRSLNKISEALAACVSSKGVCTFIHLFTIIYAIIEVIMFACGLIAPNLCSVITAWLCVAIWTFNSWMAEKQRNDVRKYADYLEDALYELRQKPSKEE